MKRITLASLAPYVGLRPFEEREALLFFGRDAHVRDLLRKFAQQRFTAVIGVSGSGKSSLVRAGLIPALHSGDLSRAGHRWNVFIFKPGNAPLANLAKELVRDERWVGATDGTAEDYLVHALAVSPLTLAERYRSAGDSFAGEAVLLVVDQFEEIFRYRHGDRKERQEPPDQGNIDEAEAFVKLLLRSAAVPEVPIYVLITMRTDFLGQCSVFYGLPEAINGGVYLTPRLDRDQLTSVIASPLALADGSIDGALVAHLMNTLGDEDELPVLEHALLRMWENARAMGRTRIDESDFQAMCPPPADPGLGKAGADQTAVAEVPKSPRLNYALDRHASEIYDKLTPAQQRIARRLFLALSERREGQDVRRPQRLCELLEQIGQKARDDVLAVIEAYRAEGVGFLMPPAQEALSEDKVIDISHESLIRQWQHFRRWLREEQADVAELREWQHRAAQNREAGGGWLDENDAERARRWRARIEERGVPTAWLKRYFPSDPGGAEAVFGYIDESARRVREDRENRERLERKAKDAEIKGLQAEARWQKKMADSSERERARAEASARTSRRVTRVAMASTVVVGLVAAFMIWLWWKELTIEHGRAKVLSWLHRYHIEPEMVEISAGSFRMGDLQGTGEADEKPVRKVEFQRPFAIGKYEVTFAEYDRYLYAQGFKERNFPNDLGVGRERRPVIHVSWDDAVAYARWLSKQTGKRYRLPTEAEWEYVARGGTTSAFFWSDDASQACTYGNVFDRGNEADLRSRWSINWESAACEDDYAATAPVGSFKANAYGVHDTAGNVWEWVEDCYHESYEGAPLDGSAWNDDGCGLRVVRGGSWFYSPRFLRASIRDKYPPGRQFTNFGFRLARDP